MVLWLLAVAGSALVLTQSSATTKPRERLLKGAPILGKLISCPMCSGFWIGQLWGVFLLPLTIPNAVQSVDMHWFPMFLRILANGFAGSIVSAIGVALWLALSEAQAVSYLWRTKNSGSAPRFRIPLKMQPAYINNTNTVFSCNCGEPVCAGCSHFLTERCGEERTEVEQ